MRGRRIAFSEPLARLLHVAVKHEEAIGIALGIGEVELPALRQLHAQVLLQIVHLEGLEIQQRRRERVVPVARLVPNPLRRRHQPTTARADRVLVDHVD